MLTNNRAQTGTVSNFIYALITIFGLSVLYYFMVEVAIVSRLAPILVQIVSSSGLDAATKAFLYGRYDFLIFVLRFIPASFFLVIVIWLFIVIFKTEQDINY